MKAEHLFHVLGLIDEDLIEEAASPIKRRPWRRYLAAACIAVLCTGSTGWMLSKLPSDKTNEAGITGDSGASGVEGAACVSYAGPVFPLTLAEETSGLTAERRTIWDFAPEVCEDGSLRQWGAQVTDSYLLTNHTAEDITVTAYYPFAGSLLYLDTQCPTLRVDGAERTVSLLAGDYAGSFQGVWEPDGQGGHRLDHTTLNLSSPEHWTDYQALLEDGSYLEKALAQPPFLDLPVTVYSFTDDILPEQAPDAATQAVSFAVDPTQTTILTYGFNGSEWDTEQGWRRYSYFVPSGARRDRGPKLLIVLGADLADYTLTGYADGGCDPSEELDGVSCTVIRQESTLDAVLDALCRSYLETDASRLPDAETALLFRRAAADWLLQYGPLSETCMDRYADGRLDDLLAEAYALDRVFYLDAPLTIPANGTAEVTLNFRKKPSFHFACAGSEDAGLQGYDLVTRLGSVLTFTRQQAALAHWENIQIHRQTFGFDLEQGLTEAILPPGAEQYVLEIRPQS